MYSFGFSRWPDITLLTIIIWPCLTKTGNYQVQEFDWLKWILTAVWIFPSLLATRPVKF